jgi:hypothetical protein
MIEYTSWGLALILEAAEFEKVLRLVGAVVKKEEMAR